MIQRKAIKGLQKAPHVRFLPPSLLEWRSTRQRSNMALALTMADSTVTTIHVDSWTTCEEAASTAVTSLGINGDGWSVILDDAGVVTESNGFEYVFDLISELELCPAFPVVKNQLLKVGTRHHTPVEVDHTPSPARPQVP